MEEYRLTPPAWRAPLRDDRKGSISGYPDLYETFPTQEEDRLTESNVRDGFAGKAHVQSEAFSAHTMIHEKLANNGILPELTKLVSDVQRARQACLGDPGVNTFEPPGRTTLTQGKLEAWVNDIANPAVPLEKLAKNSFPRGYTNDKLLELLTSKKVPIDRAVWYIRATGASEIRASSSQDVDRVSSYTQEWTNVVCDFIKKLLNEIVLPSMVASAARVAVKGKVKATLTDPVLRQNWGSRFGYLTMLIRQLYSEGLLAPDAFLDWHIAQLKTAHFGQLPFVLHLIESYIDEHLESGRLSKGIVEKSLLRLKEIEADQQSALLEDVRFSIQHLLETILALRPAAFVQPSIWLATSRQIRSCFELPIERPSLSTAESAAIALALQTNLESCSKRASVLLCEPAHRDGSPVSAPRLRLIEILDSICFPCDLDRQAEAFFSARGSAFADRLDVLLVWATAATRQSPAQPYAAASLLSKWCAKHSQAAVGLQGRLEGWLDRQTPSLSHDRILRLYSELCRLELFSFNRYYDSMVASGQTELSTEKEAGLHQLLIRCLPRDALQSSMRRRSARPQVATEEVLDDGLQTGLREACRDRISDPTRVEELNHRLASMQSRDAMQRSSDEIVAACSAAEPLNSGGWANAVRFLATLQDFSRLSQLCVAMLAVASQRDLVFIIADTISVYIDVWAALGSLQPLTHALLAAYGRLDGKQQWPVSATGLLLELENQGLGAAEIRRTLHGTIPQPLLQAEEGSDDLAASADRLLTSGKDLAGRALRAFGTMRTDWLPVLLSRSIDALRGGVFTAEKLAADLTELNEVAQLDVGQVTLSTLASLDHDDLLEQVMEQLITKNVISLPALLRGVILPHLQRVLVSIRTAEQSAEADMREAASCMRLLDKLAACWRESTHSVDTLHQRARWRSLLSGDDFPDLCRALALAFLCEYSAGSKELSSLTTDALSSCRHARVRLMDIAAVRRAVTRHGRGAMTALLAAGEECPAPARLALLDEVARWTATFDRATRSPAENTMSLEMWSLLPAEIAEWHINLIRLDMQLYLKRSSLQPESRQAQDVFLQRLMLNSDPSMAEGLLRSFTKTDVEKLFEALCVRACVGLAGTDIVDGEGWDRLMALSDLLLHNSEQPALRHLSLSTAVLHTLLERIRECFQTALNGQRQHIVSRAYFALCLALRCKEITIDGTAEELSKIAVGLVKMIDQASGSAATLRPALLAQDVLSFMLDNLAPSSAIVKSVGQACSTLSMSAVRSEIEWLICSAPSVAATHSLQLSPWELYDVAPLPGINSSAIDLEQLHASVIASGLTAKQKPDSTPEWTNYAGYGQGVQSRFDSEWPVARESVASRDFRRGILDESAPQPTQARETDEVDSAVRSSLKRKATDEGKPNVKKAATVNTVKPKKK